MQQDGTGQDVTENAKCISPGHIEMVLLLWKATAIL